MFVVLARSQKLCLNWTVATTGPLRVLIVHGVAAVHTKLEVMLSKYVEDVGSVTRRQRWSRDPRKAEYNSLQAEVSKAE